MRSLITFAILYSIVISACVTTKEASSKKKHRSRDIIYLDEIKRSHATDAYDLIKSLRPHWLRGRGKKTIYGNNQVSQPIVYMESSRHGDIDSLSTISTDNIFKIRFLTPSDSAFQFGLNHPGGVIVIDLLN